jgi:hypothetical protein
MGWFFTKVGDLLNCVSIVNNRFEPMLGGYKK